MDVINKKFTADLASASMQHKERDYSLIYLTFLKNEKNKQKHYLNLRNMIKAFNLTMLDAATYMSCHWYLFQTVGVNCHFSV